MNYQNILIYVDQSPMELHSLTHWLSRGSALFGSTVICHVLLGRFHHYAAQEPEIICHKTKKNKALIAACPALFDFKPTPLYALDYYGFLQTIGQTVLKSIGRAMSKIGYTRELFRLSDGGTVGLDWVSRVDGKPVFYHPDSPVVIIQHGLCGDSNVEYVIHIAEMLCRKQFKVAVMVARGCGGIKMTSHVPFSFGRTLDFDEVVDHIHRLHPCSKLFAVGFSLGACLTLRHVAINAETTPLSGALCVSPPWDFAVSSTFMFEMVWTKILVSAIKIYYWLNRDTMDPEILSQVYRAASVYEYDDVVATIHGHSSRDDYYSASSPKFVTNQIRVPTLAVHLAT